MVDLKQALRRLYLELCDEHDVFPGSPDAEYLWKEYVSDIDTLAILQGAELFGETQ